MPECYIIINFVCLLCDYSLSCPASNSNCRVSVLFPYGKCSVFVKCQSSYSLACSTQSLGLRIVTVKGTARWGQPRERGRGSLSRTHVRHVVLRLTRIFSADLRSKSKWETFTFAQHTKTVFVTVFVSVRVCL